MKFVQLLVLGLGLSWAAVGMAQEVDDLDKKAIEYSQQGQFELAVQTWEEARSKLASDSYPRQYMDISVDLAAAYQSLGRLQDALEVLQSAKSVAEKSNDSLGLANVLGQFADVYLAMGNLEYKDGRFTGKTRQSALDENLKTAEGYLKDAWTLVKDTNHSLLKANILNKQGNLSMMQKSYDCAMEKDKYDCAMEKYNAAKENVTQDELLKIDISLNLIQAKVRKIEFQIKPRNLRKFEEQQRALLLSECAEKIKSFQTTVDDSIKDAVDDIESTLSKVQQLSASREYKLSALTSLVHFVRNLQKTLGKTNFWKSQRLEGLRSTLEGSLVKEIDAFKEKSVAETKNYLERKSLRNEMDGIKGNAIAEASNYLAESYADFITEQCAKEKQKCYKFIEGAVQFISTSMPSAHSFKFWLQDDIPEECKSACTEEYFSSCGQNKLTETCKEMCTKVPQLFSQNYHPEWRFHLEWQLGRIYKAQQQFSKAVEAYERAVNYLQLVRQSYFGDSQAFSEKAEKFYLDRADLLLKSAKKAVTKREEQNLLQLAIDSVESRNEKGLQNYFRDACVTKQFPTENKRQLQQDEILFYPVLFNDRLELVLKFSDGKIKQLESPFSTGSKKADLVACQAKDTENKASVTSKEDLEKLVEHFRAKDADDYTIATALYDLFIRPITNDLSQGNIKTVLIVPAPDLLHIPFGALIDASKRGKYKTDGEYLIEKYALAILPSWKLVATATTDDKSKYQALLSGLKEVPYAASLPKLEWVAGELDQLNTILGLQCCTIFLDNLFTVTNLMDEKMKGKYSIIHLSTHGQFEEDSSKSLLYAYDKVLTLDSLQVLVQNAAFQGKRIELLALTACQTALGAELGMAGIGVKAGARSTLGTLWKVKEESTAKLAISFYQNWKGGDGKVQKTKAQALQEAQEYLLSYKDKDFSRPYYWAGFLLVGDWK
ncbi:MAG: hypothetical protein BWK78_02570 [Thiotrichaceae bacterium IS1]|nr:MAG: hypothetical protein BWK78_02570 [Thiotrichaceae bacterium IS1]